MPKQTVPYAEVEAPANDMTTRVARTCFLIGAFLMPMLAFRVGGHSTATEASGLTISDGFFALAFGFLLLSIHRRKLPPLTSWYLGSIVVVVGGIIASYVADSVSGSLLVVARMIFVLLIWLWTARHLIPTEALLHKAMTAYVLGCSVSGLVAILQLGAHVLVSLGTLTNGRASGLAKAPDDTGSLLALGLTFAVGLALHPSVKRKWLYVGSIAAIATGLIISGSVSGMLCGLIGVAVVILRYGIKLKHVLAVGLLLVAVYAVGTAIQAGHGGSLNPIARFTSATSSGSQNNSVNDREGTWKNSWSGIVHDPWVGHGLDVYSSLVYEDPNDFVSYPPHNLILMGWYQGGVLFVIGEFICILTALVRMRRNGVMDATKNVLFAGAVAVFAFSMQGPTMYDRYFWLPFVLAMTLPPAALYESRRRSSRELSLADPGPEAVLQPST